MYLGWSTMTSSWKGWREISLPSVDQRLMNSSQDKSDYVSMLDPPSFSFQLLSMVMSQYSSPKSLLWLRIFFPSGRIQIPKHRDLICLWMSSQYLPGLWLPMQKRASLLQAPSLTSGSVHVSKTPQGTPRDTSYLCVGNWNHLWCQPSSFTLASAQVKSEMGSLSPVSCPAKRVLFPSCSSPSLSQRPLLS